MTVFWPQFPWYLAVTRVTLKVGRVAAKLTAAAARLQKAEKIVLLLLLAMAAASGDLAFYPFKKNVHVTGNHRLLD